MVIILLSKVFQYQRKEPLNLEFLFLLRLILMIGLALKWGVGSISLALLVIAHNLFMMKIIQKTRKPWWILYSLATMK